MAMVSLALPLKISCDIKLCIVDSYQKAGVHIQKADRLISYLKPLVKKTYDSQVLGHLGGYGALYQLDLKKYKDPVIVTTTDGVGTKLKIANLTNKHDTIGIDLVAMCVNDILCCGAQPKLFLDYYATGQLNSEISQDILKGILLGCREAKCSLVGGETAEMPGFYQKEEYDLAGFCVGLANRDEIFNPELVKEGDVLIALPSSGLHSNGFSLVRKIVFEDLKMRVTDSFGWRNLSTVGEELLKPTRIYVSLFEKMRRSPRFTRDDKGIKGAAHITGGGITENLPRIFSNRLSAEIHLSSWKWPAIFQFLQSKASLSQEEMLRTFNCGVGMIVIVDQKNAKNILSFLHKEKEEAWVIGKMVKRERKEVVYS